MERESTKNLLANLERISSEFAGSGLNPEKFSGLESEISEISAFLGINEVQCVLFAVIAGEALQGSATFLSVADKLGCSVLKLMTHSADMDVLHRKSFVSKTIIRRNQKNSYANSGLAVPRHIIDAIGKGDRKLLRRKKKFDLPGFLKAIAELVNEREEETISTEMLFTECRSLISNNTDLAYVKHMDKKFTELSSKITLFSMAYVKLKGQGSINLDAFAHAMFDDLGPQIEFVQGFTRGGCELLSAGYVEVFDPGPDFERMINLSKKAIMLLHLPFPGLAHKRKVPEGIILHGNIREQKLFFTGETGEEIAKLEKAIKFNNFRKYTKELKQNRLNPCITAIFHGAPGTGKTEIVYQLARKSGRDIMMVDLSKTKSKWFGESEKVVKKIFDDYREHARSTPVEPILFINEGDGLFSHRLNLENGGTSADFAVNTIQNVLLQELEDFEGIFITTTNLAANLDRAFERRLTFKIEFRLPDTNTRKRIWQNKIPDLTTRQAGELASRFNMSGGEIDIAVRKLLLQRVISKKTDIYSMLLDSCNSAGSFTKTKKIGFASTPQID